MTELIKPKEFLVEDGEGKQLRYILSNFPAVEGREIVSKYPLSNLPKIGDYKESEETMFKLMKYVAVEPKPGVIIPLATRDLVNNHCPDWEVLGKIEMAMMEKNCSFFRNGKSYAFFENLAQIFLTRISEMLIPLSVPSSPTEKQPSTN